MRRSHFPLCACVRATASTLAGALVLGVATGCSDAAAPADPPCTGHVSLQVGRGTRPTISWQPSCGVGNVLVVSVTDSGYEAPQWGATSFNSSIVPPVAYGVKPAGAQEALVLDPADSLTIGTTYMVTVGPPVRGGVTDSLRFTVQASTP